MRGQMGKMTKDVYDAELQIINTLREKYEGLGVAKATVDEWYVEQKRLLDLENLSSTGNVLNDTIRGFKAAGKQITHEIKSWGERVYEFSLSLQNSIATGLENTMRDFDNWKDHLLDILEEIYWSAIRIAFLDDASKGLATVFTTAASAISGAVAGQTGGAGMPKVGTVTPQAGATLAKYQHGGLALSPHVAVVGEVPEVITPISEIKEIFGGSQSIQVHLHNEGTPQQITKEQSYLLSDQRIIDVFVNDATNRGKSNRAIKQVTGAL
jgi:hypothetical protein